MLKKKNKEYQGRLLTLKQVSTEAGAQGKKKQKKKHWVMEKGISWAKHCEMTQKCNTNAEHPSLHHVEHNIREV